MYLDDEFNDLCGFTHSEVKKVVADTADECGMKREEASEALDMMHTYYNGHKFAQDTEDLLYNPTLVIYSMLLPTPSERDDGVLGAKKLYQKGNMKHRCEFVEQQDPPCENHLHIPELWWQSSGASFMPGQLSRGLVTLVAATS